MNTNPLSPNQQNINTLDDGFGAAAFGTQTPQNTRITTEHMPSSSDSEALTASQNPEKKAGWIRGDHEEAPKSVYDAFAAVPGAVSLAIPTIANVQKIPEDVVPKDKEEADEADFKMKLAAKNATVANWENELKESLRKCKHDTDLKNSIDIIIPIQTMLVDHPELLFNVGSASDITLIEKIALAKCYFTIAKPAVIDEGKPSVKDYIPHNLYHSDENTQFLRVLYSVNISEARDELLVCRTSDNQEAINQVEDEYQSFEKAYDKAKSSNWTKVGAMISFLKDQPNAAIDWLNIIEEIQQSSLKETSNYYPELFSLSSPLLRAIQKRENRLSIASSFQNPPSYSTIYYVKAAKEESGYEGAIRLLEDYSGRVSNLLKIHWLRSHTAAVRAILKAEYAKPVEERTLENLKSILKTAFPAENLNSGGSLDKRLGFIYMQPDVSEPQVAAVATASAA